MERSVYVIRNAVNYPRGIVGGSRRRPCGERPAVPAVACHFSDGIAEGPLALNDLLGHDGGARAGGGGGAWCAGVSCWIMWTRERSCWTVLTPETSEIGRCDFKVRLNWPSAMRGVELCEKKNLDQGQ